MESLGFSSQRGAAAVTTEVPQAPPPPVPAQVEAVVIGSGAGGLTAAGMLASHGLNVLVLEQQHAFGGCLSSFRHDGYQFDVGLHYVSDWGADGIFPRFLRTMGAAELSARPLDPDGFDTLSFPDFTFRVPSDVELFRDRLVAMFPAERRGIDRYVRAIGECRALLGLAAGRRGLVRRLWGARHALRYAAGTVADFLDSCTRDPQLQAVLAAQNAIYGEPPSRASLFEHLIAVSSYLEEGAYYPAGGGTALAERMVGAIVRHHGRVVTGARVTRILVERGRVTGVAYRLEHEEEERVVRARVVVSDADLKHTLLDLVPAAALRARTRRRVSGYEMGAAFGAVYLGVRRDLRAEGVPNTNFWIYNTYDLERVYADARECRFDPMPPCFVSFASLKDPDDENIAPPGIANVELMSIAPSAPEAWGTTAEEFMRGAARDKPAYREVREEYAERLLQSAERVLPGLAGDVEHIEISTPLTHWKYTGATGGTPYGIAPIPSQILWRRPRTTTEIDGLYLCGASTMFGGGVLAVMWSGLLAAANVIGREVIAEVARPRAAVAG